MCVWCLTCLVLQWCLCTVVKHKKQAHRIPSLLQQVFLSLSSHSSWRVQHRLWHIDWPLSRLASGFNTTTSQHVNSSTGYTSYLLCLKVMAISPLWTTQIRWQPHRCEHRHLCANILHGLTVCRPIWSFMNTCVIKAFWPGLIGSRQSNGCVLLKQRIFSSLMHNIGLELINLSVILLDYTRDECGDGLDLLSEGGLSLKDGIYLDWMLQ